MARRSEQGSISFQETSCTSSKQRKSIFLIGGNVKFEETDPLTLDKYETSHAVLPCV